ncbi:MAG: hypothetical protein MJ211_01635 [Bacteroidales bacterium]|nr:hypothetical protein [Bacteroidales bacterium]
MKFNKFFIICSFFVTACNFGSIDTEELYSNLSDKQKLAAEFLLSEVDNRYTLTNQDLTDFYPFIDSLSLTDVKFHEQKQLLEDFFANHSSAKSYYVYDKSQLTTQYLKQNILDAFKYYQQSWNSYLPDTAFFQYVLPYRVGDEPLEDWRNFFIQKYGYILDSLINTNQPISTELLATEILKVLKLREIKTLQTNVYSKTLRPSTLDKIKVGQCTDYCDYVNFVMRTFGIPCAKDGIFDWHCWNAILAKDSTIDVYVECTPEDQHLKNWLFYTGWKNLPKIWRETFTKNPNSLAEIHGEEPIPQYFKNPYMVDVSNEYFEGQSADFQVDNNPYNSNFAYLKVWNNKFVYVDWAKIEKDNAKFNNISDSVVYFPSYYNSQKEQKPLSYPFVITEKGRRDFVADTINTQKMVLYRKYLIKRTHNLYLKRMLDGYFIGANKPDFSDSVRIYTISEMPLMKWNEVEISLNKSFKYIKYVAPIWSWLNVAELEFYNPEGKKLKGKILGCNNFSEAHYSSKNAFDGDVLTYVDAIEPHYEWLGLEFDEPQQISKIRYIPRNDDNFVQKNQLYELQYADLKGWHSMGIQNAYADSVTFYNVPSNAIYLLKDLTKGHEERIFEYVDGKQVFW